MIGFILIPRFLFFLVAWLALTFASSSAMADGKVFRSALAESPPIPDHQAPGTTASVRRSDRASGPRRIHLTKRP